MAQDITSPCPPDHPMMIAWKAYQETDDFKNIKHWAMRVAPMFYAGDDEKTQREQAEQLMPHEHRQQHVQGALWAAFSEGWRAALTERKKP